MGHCNRGCGQSLPAPPCHYFLFAFFFICSFLQGTSTCFSVGSSTGCSMEFCSGVVHPQSARASLLGAWGTSYPFSSSSSSCSPLAVCAGPLITSHPSPPPAMLVFALPSSGCPQGEAPPSWLWGLALPCGEAVGVSWVQHRAALASPHTRSGHQNPATAWGPALHTPG